MLDASFARFVAWTGFITGAGWLGATSAGAGAATAGAGAATAGAGAAIAGVGAAIAGVGAATVGVGAVFARGPLAGAAAELDAGTVWLIHGSFGH